MRKLGFGEKFMSGAADYGIMSTVYGLWFESRHTVTLRHVREASGIVAQSVIIVVREASGIVAQSVIIVVREATVIVSQSVTIVVREASGIVAQSL